MSCIEGIIQDIEARLKEDDMSPASFDVQKVKLWGNLMQCLNALKTLKELYETGALKGNDQKL